MRFFLFACLVGVSSALMVQKVKEPVAGEYVVQFKNGVSLNDRQNHIKSISLNSTVFKEYDFPGFSGYAAKITNTMELVKLLESPVVQLVEENGIMRISKGPKACVTQSGTTWGLVRTGQEDLNINGQYTYEESAGANVQAYVIDTGIYIEHNDFGGRARWGSNHVDTDNTDGNGHGTHCAGTVGGELYGMSKTVDLIAVKVLSAGGSGSTAGVIAGINWVVNDVLSKVKDFSKKVARAVANMSLGGGRSTAMNNAVDAAVDNEIVFAVAAGNDNRDACNYSPASSENAIGVGASDNTDAMAYFSNWGGCVDIFGPGVGITSAWNGGPNSDNTISGTSMAAPHVCGLAAKLMSAHPTYDADKIKDEMLATASEDKLTGVKGSPNKLTYQGCEDYANKA